MKSKTVYVCSTCGYKSPKWLGKCPSCNAWNTLEEETEITEKPVASRFQRFVQGADNSAIPYSELELPSYIRSKTGRAELDRVLGGGIVSGSVVLISGEPGIGKSTLLMQISDSLSATAVNGKPRRVMYVSGEESGGQLKMRAERLGIKGDNLYILTETSVTKILEECGRIKPDILIIDSIQTIFNSEISSVPGSVTQVRECTISLISKAKTENISVILVGHINKDGNIAGPKILEHMVDAVLYFEGERRQQYRIIRAIKNRYGSTNEIGVFEMTDRGLVEIPNPSEMLLSGRPKNVSGNCAVCTMEGTRPIIAEVQALVTPTVFPAPRRTSNGIDYNRLCLILAVLEKRLGLRFSQNDVYLNVIGGLNIDEPAADVAVALALISSLTNRIIPDDLIAIGELGLAGECRAVSELEYRVKEAFRLGFNTVIVPEGNEKIDGGIMKNASGANADKNIKIIPIGGIFEALPHLMREREDNV